MKCSVACLLLAALAAPTALAADAILKGDAHFFTTGGKANKAFGSDKQITLNSQTSALLQFDLSTLPTGIGAADVQKANLWLFVVKVKKPGDFAVHAASAPWDEETVNGASNPGFINAGSDPMAVGLDKDVEGEFVVVDVTPIVQGWVAGTLVNNGLALTPVGSVDLRIASHEGDPADRPRLEILTGEPGDAVVSTAFGSGPIGSPLTNAATYQFVPGSTVDVVVAAGDDVHVWASAAVGNASGVGTGVITFDIGFRLASDTVSEPATVHASQTANLRPLTSSIVMLSDLLSEPSLTPGTYTVGLVYKDATAAFFDANGNGRVHVIVTR